MRNNIGLSPEQINKVTIIWKFLMDAKTVPSTRMTIPVVQINTSNAHKNGSITAFNESTNTIQIGADVYPNMQYSDANSKLSLLACLCHEFAHAQRYAVGFDRPISGIEKNLDEAETSLHASFIPCLQHGDRMDLIQDAELRIENWKRGNDVY